MGIFWNFKTGVQIIPIYRLIITITLVLASVASVQNYTLFYSFFCILLFLYLKMNLITCLIALNIVWPIALTGQNKILLVEFLTIYVIFAIIICNTYLSGKFRINKFKTGTEILFLLLFVLAAVVYLPVLTEYLGFGYIPSLDRAILGDLRSSHLLSFALPLLTVPIFFRMAYECADMVQLTQNQIRNLQFIIVFYLMLSFMRFLLQIDLLPQDYAAVRFDGYRLSGFANPDPNGFARTLILPIFLSWAMFSIKKNLFGLFVLSILIICLVMTGSRSGIVALMFSVLFFLCITKTFSRSFIIIISLFIFSVIIIFTGVVDETINRSFTGSFLSGRLVIYLTVIDLLFQSPWVGLRPGGFIVWLSDGQTYLGTALKVQSAHSLYLELAINWGLVVLLLFITASISLLLVAVRISLKAKRHTYKRDKILIIAALASTCFGYLILGIIENIPISNILLVQAALLVCIKIYKKDTGHC
jgi:hypothetical protein